MNFTELINLTISLIHSKILSFFHKFLFSFFFSNYNSASHLFNLFIYFIFVNLQSRAGCIKNYFYIYKTSINYINNLHKLGGTVTRNVVVHFPFSILKAFYVSKSISQLVTKIIGSWKYSEVNIWKIKTKTM